MTMYNGSAWVDLGSSINHQSLVGVGTLTHTTIDARLGQAVNITSAPAFGGLTVSASANNPIGTQVAIITNTYATSLEIIDDPMPVLRLVRSGTAGQNPDACATFLVDRYINSGSSACTRLTIGLAHQNSTIAPINVFQMLSSGICKIPCAVNATSNTAGALIVAGGICAGNGLYAGGAIRFSGITQATADDATVMIPTGGLTVGGNCYLKGAVSITNATTSNSTTTGALVVTGGVGVTGDTYAGSFTTAGVIKTTNATSGALIVAGGAGITGTVTAGGLAVDYLAGGYVATLLCSNTSVTDTSIAIGRANAVDSCLAFSYHWDAAVGTTAQSATLGIRGRTALRLFGNSRVQCLGTESANSVSTGALVVGGGMGVAGAIYCQELRNSGLSVFSSRAQFDNANDYDATAASIECGGGIDAAKGIRAGTVLIVSGTTAASSSSTGALIVGGGVGVAKKLYVGDTTASTSSTSGALVVAGGICASSACTFLYLGAVPATDQVLDLHNTVATSNIVLDDPMPVLRLTRIGTTDVSTDACALFSIDRFEHNLTNARTRLTIGLRHDTAGTIDALQIYSSKRVAVLGTNVSNSTTTGALTVAGGLGVVGAAYVGSLNTAGAITCTNETLSESVSTGALTIAGGLGVVGAAYVGSLTTAGAVTCGSIVTTGALSFTNETSSSSTTTGALVLAGGLGVSDRIYAESLHITDLTESSTATTGCALFDGGVGVAKRLCATTMSCMTAPSANTDVLRKVDIGYITTSLTSGWNLASSATAFALVLTKAHNIVTITQRAGQVIDSITGSPTEITLKDYLPAAYKPTTEIKALCTFYTNLSVITVALIRITDAGEVSFSKIPAAAFTTDQITINAFSCSYNII